MKRLEPYGLWNLVKQSTFVCLFQWYEIYNLIYVKKIDYVFERRTRNTISIV